VIDCAVEFWFPRVLAGPAGVALWALASFFNGIGHTRITLLLMGSVAVVNAALNRVFIFKLGLGVAGAAWASGAAQLFGVCLALALFLSAPIEREYHSHRQWRPRARELGAVFALGVPMELPVAVDPVGLALFQAMPSALDAISGAATQIVMMLTCIAYMPSVGA